MIRKNKGRLIQKSWDDQDGGNIRGNKGENVMEFWRNRVMEVKRRERKEIERVCLEPRVQKM